MNLLNFGGTQTGGATVILAPAGNTAGRSNFTTPQHNRKTPNTVAFIAQVPSASNASAKGSEVGRAALQIVLSDEVDGEEGCCTTQKGFVAADIGVRIGLNQPDAAVTRLIETIRAAVYTPEFAAMVRNGVTPSA